MIAVDSNLRFAKQQLIKVAEGVDNGKCFFLNLRIMLFSCSEGTRAKRDRLPVDFSCPGILQAGEGLHQDHIQTCRLAGPRGHLRQSNVGMEL